MIKIKAVDGAGSGLDADLLDGVEYSAISTEIDTAETDANTYTDTHEAKTNPHSASVSDADLATHAGNTDNPHTVTQNQIGIYVQSAEPSSPSTNDIWIKV